MSRTFLYFIACLLWIAPCCGQSATKVVHDSSKWKDQIARFEAADKLQAPPKNAYLFVGSSSIRKWDLARSFPELTTINRGFGGSQLMDSVNFIDSIVLKHEPLAVIMYAGDNDLNAGKSPERVFADFAQFVAIMQEQRPNTTLHYIGVKHFRRRACSAAVAWAPCPSASPRGDSRTSSFIPRQRRKRSELKLYFLTGIWDYRTHSPVYFGARAECPSYVLRVSTPLKIYPAV